MTLMQRRRALMGAQRASLPPIYLYDNGVISEFAGGIDNSGLTKNPNFNTVTQTANFLKYTCTSSSSASSVKGGRAFTFKNPLPASCIGRKIYVRFSHKNASSTATDALQIRVAPTVVTAGDVSAAYPDSIYANNSCFQESDFVERIASLTISKTGYVSIPAYKWGSGGGTYEFRVYEVWIE